MEAGKQGDADAAFLTLQLSKLQLHLARVRADSDARLHVAQQHIQQLQQENMLLASRKVNLAHHSVQGWVQDSHVDQPWTSPVLGQQTSCPFTPADIAFVEHEIAALQEQLDAARAKLDFSLGACQQQQHTQASPVSGLVHLPLRHATYTYQARQQSPSRAVYQVGSGCKSPYKREHGSHGCSPQQYGSRRMRAAHKSRQQPASPSKHSSARSEPRSRRHRTCRQAIELLHSGLPTMLCQKKRH